MHDFQSEKALASAFYAALDGAGAAESPAVLKRFLAPDCLWRGSHPFNELAGPGAVAERFWLPLVGALGALHRRQDIFFAGANRILPGDAVWTVSMGHLVGLFDAPWLGIPPTGKMIFLRYAEFLRIEHGRITEIAHFCDIPHLMMQAGLTPFPPQTAAHLVQPGPATHDGLLHAAQPPGEGDATQAAIDAMIGDLGTWGLGLPLEDELRRSWHEDMIWWGPAGIGATYTIPRYARQHSGPFRAAFADRSPTRHRCRVAEGHYGGFFGWPNFTATHRGGFMGMPGSDRPGEMRVVDIYRRAGTKLAENWVFIDLLHFWLTQGVDFLAQATGGESG